MGLAEVISSVDPVLLEEFQFVDRVRGLFKATGVFVSYWEGYCLAQGHRGPFQRLIEKSAAPGAPAVPVISSEILEALRTLRDRGAPIVSKLRRLASRPGTAEEAELLEMSFAVLVGAERGREAVGRWVSDPVGCAQEASERIQIVMRRLEPLRQALRPGSPEAKPAAPEPPPPAAPAEAKAPEIAPPPPVVAPTPSFAPVGGASEGKPPVASSLATRSRTRNRSARAQTSRSPRRRRAGWTTSGQN